MRTLTYFRRSRRTLLASIVIGALGLFGEWARGDGASTGDEATFRVTGVLLLDRPAKSMATQLVGRDEAKSADDFQLRIGNWDPRNRVTQHAVLPRSAANWRFSTGLHEWQISPQDQQQFAHHVFLVDRPVYHQEGGSEKERVVQIGLRSDRVTAGQRLPVRLRTIGHKGLDLPSKLTLAAFWQQAPTPADDINGWQSVRVEEDADADAVLIIPHALKPGLAWLRIGVSEGDRATSADRLLAELPLIVVGNRAAADGLDAALAFKTIEVAPQAVESRVPEAWRRGVFLHPQCVSAVDISDDGHSIGVATMAFRHDKNFWLLSDEGRPLWGRYVDPWAPFQIAVLGSGETCGIGLAYSRVTDPSPTVSHFQGETGDETVLVDNIWDMGWLRYGDGDWRSGWPASLTGDLMVRAPTVDYTVFSHDGAWRFSSSGQQQTYPLLYQRPFRMASSADGHVVACGYLSPDGKQLDEKTRGRVRLPPALLVVRNAITSANLWSQQATDVAPLARPPDAADDLPELAKDFSIKPQQWVPFQAALSVAVDGDGSRVASAEYGGWMRIKAERGIGNWNPDHQVSYCPRQRGRLRTFDARGQSSADAPFPTDGLFDLHLDRLGTAVWCAPQAWFARGMAGKAWLPTDPRSRTVYVFDVANRAWVLAFQLPDAVSDLALHPDGDRALVSCWDGKLYLLHRDGRHETRADLGDAARIRWARDGQFAVIGTQQGTVSRLDADGRLRWTIELPTATVPPAEPVKPVFDDVPVYSVGRVGPEHAYVGDIWLVKTAEGGILVDLGGASAIPTTWQRMRAAGIEPDDVKYALLSHTHGDHAGTSYLWRAQGVKIVAPRSAELALNWLMPTWSDYSLWAPARLDVPLPLARVGDETEITLCGQKVRAIFVPGHSFDATLYLMQISGKRIAFTGDIGFEGESNILHRCWGDRLKAAMVVRVVRDKLLAFQPDYVFTGHGPREPGTEFIKGLLERTEAALSKAGQ